MSAFLSYYLTKIMPYWGLAILATTVAFMVPLIYTSNQELIDHHLKNASEAINAQTSQVRNVAQKQAEQISAMGKQYAGDYTGKVQEMLRGRDSASAPSASTPSVSAPAVSVPTAKAPEFPSAPTEEPQTSAAPLEPVVPEQEPMVAS